MNNDYIDYIDGLDHEERSIFFYYFIFKLAPNDIADRLKMKQKKVRNLCNFLKQEMDFFPLRQEIFEAFKIGK